MTPPHPDLLDALRLRRWALDVLTTGARPAPDASPAAWGLFLRREACATRLRTRAGSDVPAPIRDAADRELQQILLLRAELDAVLDVAHAIGVAPILLKGSATLHLPDGALWAKDLDLLLEPAAAAALVQALAVRGWINRGGGNPMHYGDRAREGRPPVEVHTPTAVLDRRLGVQLIRRSTAHPTLAGARLLAASDQARHVVYHQSVQHPSHRGRLRDLILLADCISTAGVELDPSGWEIPQDAAKPVDQTLALARALVRREPTPDPFPLIAAIWYRMDLDQSRRRTYPWTDLLAAWTLDAAAGEGGVRERIRVAFAPRVDDWSWIPGARNLGVKWPLPGRLFRALLRVIWLPAVAALGMARGLRERHLGRQALAAVDQGVEHREK